MKRITREGKRRALMVGLETLLGAAIGAGLGLIDEAGFGADLYPIKGRLSREGEKAREKAFKRALARASNTAKVKAMDALLDHEPFREAMVAGLLDPVEGLPRERTIWISEGDADPVQRRADKKLYHGLVSRSDHPFHPST